MIDESMVRKKNGEDYKTKFSFELEWDLVMQPRGIKHQEDH